MSNRDIEAPRKEKLKVRHVATMPVEGGVAESIIYNKIPVFLIYDKAGFSIIDKIKTPIEILKPLTKERFPYRPYQIPKGYDLHTLKNFNPTLQQIVELIRQELDTFLVLDDKYKVLVIISIIETYVQHKIDITSYLFFKGDVESGKTRALELFLLLAFRPLFSSSLPYADVYEYIGYHEEGTGTILEDDAHQLSKKTSLEKLKIYRSGYRRGTNCPRILEPTSKDRMQRFYKIFCSKIFAGYYLPSDEGFRARCIPITMICGDPEKSAIKKEDRIRMDGIKFCLLAWRMKNYNKPLPEIDTKMTGRLKEIWESKLQIAKGLEQNELMIDLASEYKRNKLEERRDSLNGHIVKTVFDLNKEFRGKEIPFSSIWSTLLSKLCTIHWTEATTKIASEVLGYDISKRMIGLKLATVLDGKKHLRRKAGRTWTFRDEYLERLIKKYGFTVNDVNDVNDVN